MRSIIPASCVIVVLATTISARPSIISSPIAVLTKNGIDQSVQDDGIVLDRSEGKGALDEEWYTQDVLGVDRLSQIITEPRTPIGSDRPRGWLARWLSMGGEGAVTVQTAPGENFTLPHRPAAFPSQLLPPMDLPLQGFLHPFTFLPPSDDEHRQNTFPSNKVTSETSVIWGSNESLMFEEGIVGRRNGDALPSQACIPPTFPPPRWTVPQPPYHFALVERGGCDFATKVRAAQERGAAGAIVGDTKANKDETDEEGMQRENLITMFSPEDTDNVFIPSVFVSRASYLVLSDMLANHTSSGSKEGSGLWIEIGEGSDEEGALSSLLSFALLMPSLFLLATIGVHRIRVARQREAERAPPLLVLSLPERIWTPDIVWEKDSDEESPNSSAPPSPDTPTPISRPSLAHTQSHLSSRSQTTITPRNATGTGDRSRTNTSSNVAVPPPPPISPAEVPTPPLGPVDNSGNGIPSGSRKKRRTKSGISGTGKRYFGKDECAICMDSFQRGEIVRILPCGHVFHKEECDEWLMKWRKLCPTCRADVTLPSDSAVQGATITPVAPPRDPDDEDEDMPIGRRLMARLRSAREWAFGGRIALREDDQNQAEAGETTPLVPRSPESTGAPQRPATTPRRATSAV